MLMEQESALNPHVIWKLESAGPPNFVIFKHRSARLSGYLPAQVRPSGELVIRINTRKGGQVEYTVWCYFVSLLARQSQIA